MSILVRNLPRSLSEADLKTMFTPYGEIESCQLVMDQQTGLSKGFGFIEFTEQESIDKAIDALNSKVLEGNKIRVKWSNQEKRQAPVSSKPDLDYSNAWNHVKKDSDE
ncbi:RNA recognition motif domain-containing protein [Planctobacterium marinum]|uniref:RNA recognition motif domain-containing protein n=1 Tax=Planctobacterium marinum TaxID=1631968 RepID=UPI001E5C57F7|nr:RNA-binding protein [Planctobacterium marinum]MCC2604436.1 RNA-binding protein [Planctobacterium marinum]